MGLLFVILIGLLFVVVLATTVAKLL